MWVYIIRRLLYNVPVYLAILTALFFMLRVNDPVYSHISKDASAEEIQNWREQHGMADPVPVQLMSYFKRVLTLRFDQESWQKKGLTVGEILTDSVKPSLAITVPSLLLTATLSIVVGLISAFYRGRLPDKTLVFLAVLGMCVSFAVYVIVGQYFAAAELGAFLKNQWGWERGLFAISGYFDDPTESIWQVISDWRYYCLLPVLISMVVAMGYDTRFYRSVMVEESTRDYITTAVAKGVAKPRVMFVHMLKNAMIPIISRVMTTLPFLITGSFLLEQYFSIPGMGRELITAIGGKDFPVVETFTAMFAGFFILTNILTDVLYALVDPRVRLQ